MLQDCNLSDVTSALLAYQISHSPAIVGGTDGGLLNGDGTFGFVFGDSKTRETYVEAFGRVPGLQHIMSSTRTELCGLFAALTYV